MPYCATCGRKPTHYVILILDGMGRTPYVDDYYCFPHMEALPQEGQKYNGLIVIEREDKKLS